MKATPLILALTLTVTSAQAFTGAMGRHYGHGGHGIIRALGRYGSVALVPDVPPPAPELPVAPAVERPYLEGPAFAPELPQPYALPAAHPRHSGPKIIYIGKPPKGDGPRVIYGTD